MQAAKAAPSSILYGPKAFPCPWVLPPPEGVLHAELCVTGSANLFQTKGDQNLSTNAAAGTTRTPFSILHPCTPLCWLQALRCCRCCWIPSLSTRKKPLSFQSIVQGCSLGFTSPCSPALVHPGACESTAVTPPRTHLQSHEQLGVRRGAASEISASHLAAASGGTGLKRCSLYCAGSAWKQG